MHINFFNTVSRKLSHSVLLLLVVTTPVPLRSTRYKKRDAYRARVMRGREVVTKTAGAGVGDASLSAALRHEPHTQPLTGKLVESFGII